MSSPGYVAFKLAMQLTPIILTRGIATAIGAIPIIALTEGPNFLDTLLSGGDGEDLDSYFAHFYPMPGASLIDNQVAKYPFANQAVAANAIITQPLRISMRMVAPASGTLGYAVKLATMLSLQQALAQHNSLGGTYSIITPSYIYTDCLLTGVRDMSSGETQQPQYAWQFDFEQPLISLQAAQSAYNGLMQKLASGVPISGTPSWSSGLPIGNPANLLTQSLTPGALA